ncbi:MAG: hypothetical protein ACI4XN_04270 [Candidatus Kurthia intestinigallinarum]
MAQKTAPQIFHDKGDPKSNFLIFPSDLFAAINNIFSGNEAKVLLTLIGCKGDGSFSPSTQYMLDMTGISKPNNYFKIRKQLETNGYIEIDEQGNLYIDTKKIIDRYQNDTNNK